MFPIMLIMNYIYFANHLRMAIARRNFVFSVAVNQKVLCLIRMFLKFNIIRRIEKLTPKTYRIYISWYNNHTKLKSLVFYSLGAHPLRISHAALLVLNTHTYASNIVLSTSRGLLTHREALMYRLGGILVCIVD
jgi:ribosomal protein S8